MPYFKIGLLNPAGAVCFLPFCKLKVMVNLRRRIVFSSFFVDSSRLAFRPGAGMRPCSTYYCCDSSALDECFTRPDLQGSLLSSPTG